MTPGGPEEPWVFQYTFWCFGLSLLTAIAITFLVEKPGAWALRKGFKWLDDRWEQRKEKRKQAE